MSEEPHDDQVGSDPIHVLATVSAEQAAAATPGAAHMAAVSGVLTLNARGCFEVGGSILVAPNGSRAVRDPVGIEIPGIGRIRMGATVHGSGAYADHLVGPDDDIVTEWESYLTPSTHGYVILNEEGPRHS